ncbi:MAG: oligoendopeptidase F [Acidobacteria bacterium]|nr:oligoendopeptidase F [Acidobacteriota bacterium]
MYNWKQISQVSDSSGKTTPLTRENVPESDKWDLSDIYPSESDFLSRRNAFAADIARLSAFRGTLGRDAGTLQQALDVYFELLKTYARLSGYASLKADENMKNAHGEHLRKETRQLGVRFSETASYISPEIIAIGEEKLRAFTKENSALAPYRMFLEDMMRTARHTLSEKEELILSRTGMLAGAASNAYGIFTNSDMIFPTVTLSDSTKLELNLANFGKYRGTDKRSDRELIFQEFWKNFKHYENTFGTLLYASVQQDWFYALTRNYASSVEAALDADNIPLSVYTGLLANIHNHLPALHRYLALRKKMMGLDNLKYSDLYPPLVRGMNTKFPYETAKKHVLAALNPLGSDYTGPLRKGLESRWADVFPTDGKRSGAYSNGSCYDVHPYVLLNHTDDYESLSTLAHEFGHAMHSWFSNKNQPYPTADYSIFVAEVASTFNENLLNQYLLADTDSREMKLFLLGHALERIRTTIFRQAMFAEFELKIHETVENQNALTGETLTEIYLKLAREYYGHENGICQVDELFGIEWAFIPHFYYNFYVYQYATGMVAATALSEKILNKEPDAVSRYLAFLKSGCSDYPIPILRKAGADLETPEPFELTMRAFHRAMDEIEALLEAENSD